MALAACKPPAPPHYAKCANRSDLDALRSLSYSVHLPWPFDVIDMVLETEPSTCNLFPQQRSVCCGTGSVSPGVSPQIGMEIEVAQIIASFLSGCHRRPCRAIDLGANTGVETFAMLSLGASVVSVEPQQDLADAIRRTAALHCWQDHLVMLHAFACPWASAACDERADGRIDEAAARQRSATQDLWRPGGSWLKQSKKLGLSVAPSLKLREIFTAGTASSAVAMADAAPTPSASLRRPPPVHLDLIKADGDGPEADWLAEIERLLTLRAVTVGALVIEGQFFNSKKRMKAAHALSRLQARHGFTAFRLDTFDNRRLLGRSGWDVLSPRGTFARLDRLRVLERDAHEEEWLRLRLLEHAFRIKPNRSVHDWQHVYVSHAPVKRWTQGHLRSRFESASSAPHGTVPCQHARLVVD